VLRTLDVGWEFVDDGFEFLADPSSESVGDAAGHGCCELSMPNTTLAIGEVCVLRTHHQMQPAIIQRHGPLSISWLAPLN
jgi:hypothetical protein